MEPAIRSRGRFHKTHRRTARGLPTPSPHCPTLGVLPDSLQVLYHSELHRPNGQMNLVYKRGMVAIRGFDWLTPSALKASLARASRGETENGSSPAECRGRAWPRCAELPGKLASDQLSIAITQTRSHPATSSLRQPSIVRSPYADSGVRK